MGLGLGPSQTMEGHPECRDAIDRVLPQYMVGYGSLMERQSKLWTAPQAGPSLPVRLNGYARSFTSRYGPDGGQTTMLAVEPDPDASIVAVLFRMMDVENFVAQDIREIDYCRSKVEPSALEMLDGSKVPQNGQIWLYSPLPKTTAPPSVKYPLIQSYIDTFLNGCIQVASKVVAEDVDFVAECVRTTGSWSPHWINDRIHPRRAYSKVPNAVRIDKLLRKMVPEPFSAIRIE